MLCMTGTKQLPEMLRIMLGGRTRIRLDALSDHVPPPKCGAFNKGWMLGHHPRPTVLPWAGGIRVTSAQSRTTTPTIITRRRTSCPTIGNNLSPPSASGFTTR